MRKPSTFSVLILTDEMLPGGVPRHVTDLANGLREERWQPFVAATDGPFRQRLRQDVPFVALSFLRRDSYQKRGSGYAPAFFELVRLVREKSIRLVHTHKRYSDVLGRMVAKACRVPHVSTCHNTFDNLLSLSPFGHYTIACSKIIENMLMRDFGKRRDRVKMIYNGIEDITPLKAAQRRELMEELGLTERERCIASIGHLSADKDRGTLLRALGILKSRDLLQAVVCLVVGEGPDRDELQGLARELGLDAHVRFLGSGRRATDILSVSRFGVLSSVRDGGVPYVILEAANLGKAHVATNVGGIPEFVEDGQTGVLVPPRQPEALAEGILTLLRDADLSRKLGRSARTRQREVHSMDSFIRETIEVYRRVLNV